MTKKFFLFFFSILYLIMAFLALFFIESSKVEMLIFILSNSAITFFVLLKVDVKKESLFFIIAYFSFFFIYVLKAIVIPATGLNSKYVYTTIRVFIDEHAYVQSLWVILAAHFILVLLLSLYSYVNEQNVSFHVKSYIANGLATSLCYFSAVLISVSAIVMQHYGVAVMGSEGVSLPYGLSGLLYYGRTIFIPIILIYILELSICKKNKKIFRLAVAVFFLLAISEIIVRASKSPLLNLALYLFVLYLILYFRGIDTSHTLSRKFIIWVFILSVAMFPIVTIYRIVLFDTSYVTSISGELGSSFSNGGMITSAISSFFHRLLGFTQLAGIVAMGVEVQDFNAFFEYGSVANYYTREVLRLSMSGHASSPSLLGASLLLAGNMWFVLVVIYYFLLMLIWSLSSKLKHFEVSLKCFLAFEILNSTMAGTVDDSIYRLTLVCAFLTIIEFLFNISNKKLRS
ncbi:hypothetical protein [Vibrio nigripulchritudo]|uniref:hypothetical protein n=1 Tax=Vibrio nigripulchritudo TaxID=28173 RepID=UPI0024911E36|nr:hypothetical protein [Vibrio nigripulchritudo]BDU38866.1 hypothetical protein TUMSATVNIG2_33350 [Vibrio nigripulchritudo]BDU44585.1 hypothetical protein TUMSATVNIG3_33830 [Vibrio nigripulchritudo]